MSVWFCILSYNFVTQVGLTTKKGSRFNRHEKNNLHDLYSIGLFAKINTREDNQWDFDGHIIKRNFTLFAYISHGGILLTTVRETRFRRSPLPQGLLDPSPYIFRKMNVMIAYMSRWGFAHEYYMEPEKILIIKHIKTLMILIYNVVIS